MFGERDFAHNKASLCPPRCNGTSHNGELQCDEMDATKALSLLARAHTPTPRDSRARNTLIDLRGGRPALAWLVSGVARGPDGSADGFPIAYQIHMSRTVSPQRSAFEAT